MDLNSLRNHYAIISVALGVFVLLAAGFANYLLTDTRTETAMNIENRHILLSRSRTIRNAVWQAREALGQFLIDPERLENQKIIRTEIGEAINGAERLLAEHDRLSVSQHEQISELKTQLLNFNVAANELIDIRLDTPRQYPSLILARTELLPRQQKVFDAYTAAIQEVIEENQNVQATSRIYNLLITSRHRWALLISNVRMLIASRIGSFGLESLVQQQQDIETFYQDFREKINQLKASMSTHDIGFITATSIEEISTLSAEWYRNYNKFLKIHTSDKWRGDTQYLRLEINPILEDVWYSLLSFDVSLEGSANTDVARLSKLAQNQSYTIWIIGIAGLFVVFIGYFYFTHSVLNPVSMLARVFSEEAHARSNIVLPEVSSTEFKTLISAFTEMRKQIRNRQDALEHQTLHDSLTNLANRTLLYERLTSAIKQSKRYKDTITLILMDLDRFKEVNDTLGHLVGDQLLIAVGMRLRDLLRDSDTIARLGGDEFAILLTHSNEDEARSVSRKVLKAFEKPFDIHQRELYIGTSIGVAIYPNHGLDAETLIKCADVAMYVAKRNRLGFTFYDASNDNYDDSYLSLANDIRQALNNEEFSVHYQLKYDINSGDPLGVEALLHWEHPELKSVPPENIIRIAEQLGVINRLTLWVMEQAIKQCAQWRSQGVYLHVAVNMSVYDLQFAEIVDRISSLLTDYDVPASYLIIEISENAMLIDPIHAIDILNKLDKMDVRIAIDDFGTGFSSLGYLKRLPVDELKIDKSFVIDMIDNENDAVIVRSTIDLAHNLGLKVVAEGVESAEIYELLAVLKCDMAQGFYMCKPVPAEKILSLLKQNESKLTKSAG